MIATKQLYTFFAQSNIDSRTWKQIGQTILTDANVPAVLLKPIQQAMREEYGIDESTPIIWTVTSARTYCLDEDRKKLQ